VCETERKVYMYNHGGVQKSPSQGGCTLSNNITVLNSHLEILDLNIRPSHFILIDKVRNRSPGDVEIKWGGKKRGPHPLPGKG
jgi:hypothetical protein